MSKATADHTGARYSAQDVSSLYLQANALRDVLLGLAVSNPIYGLLEAQVADLDNRMIATRSRNLTEMAMKLTLLADCLRGDGSTTDYEVAMCDSALNDAALLIAMNGEAPNPAPAAAPTAPLPPKAAEPVQAKPAPAQERPIMPHPGQTKLARIDPEPVQESFHLAQAAPERRESPVQNGPTVSLTAAAESFRMNYDTFARRLAEMKWIHRRANFGAWHAYNNKIAEGLLTSETVNLSHHVRVTARGMQVLERVFAKRVAA